MINNSPHILFVEDEPTVRAIGEDMLASFGCTVTSAANGADALAVLEKAQPDLILSDVRMPVMDGFKLLQNVRQNPAWHDRPFVIVSAKAESSDVRMGMALGADDYVTKPYQPADMEKAIAVRLERVKRLNLAREQQNRFLTRTLPHELRTPLTGVMGYADLMVDLAADGRTLSVSELADYGHQLQISGRRIYSIVENYLFWARMETAREAKRSATGQSFVLEGVGAGDLLAVAETVAAQYHRGPDLAASCQLAGQLKVVTHGFQFVARHLIDNAFKFSLPGQQVEVITYLLEGMFCLRVTDGGRGMTAEQIARAGLFRQFDREQFEQQGMGMGLMLAQTFAQLSGGSLTLQPGDNHRGVSACLRVPCA